MLPESHPEPSEAPLEAAGRAPDPGTPLQAYPGLGPLIFHQVRDPILHLALGPDEVPTILSVNPAFTRWTGITAEQALGRPLAEVLPPSAAASLLAHVHHAVQRKAPMHWEESSLFPTGIKKGEWSLLPVLDAQGACTSLLGLVRDMTDFALVFNNVSDAIFFLTVEPGGDYRFLSINPAFTTLTGVPSEAVVGRSVREVIPEPSLTLVLDRYRQALLKRTTVRWEEVSHYPTGTKHGEVTVTPVFDGRGHGINLIGTVRDLTARRMVEAEKVRLEAKLHQAHKMESLGSLAGGIAHDMNNVLGAILGLASAHLGTLSADHPLRPAFETIAKAAERGGTMVKGLLTFARQAPAVERELNLNDLVREEVRLLERTTLAKVGINLELAEDLPAILGDGSAILHALMNLCVNAVDAMPQGGTLRVCTRRAAEGWVELQVEDSGQGMSPEVQAKAMEPFFTTKPEGKGTGLGLAMVYGTMKAHRGHLSLHSEVGRGTRVTLVFPPMDPGVDPAEPLQGSRGSALDRPHHILLVDDDELIRSSMGALFDLLGHASTLAQSGEAALALLEGGLAPDAVILDMNMPGLGGEGTLPRLRALRPDLPVFLATGRPDQAVLDLVAAHSGVTLLAKPYSLQDLQQHLEGLKT